MKALAKWLNIYEEEIGLFFWTAILFFLIRTSGILFNNYAETAFLKRYGVEYLPIVYVVNSFSTFFIMGFLTGIMSKMPTSRLLSRMLIFCGVTVAGLRFVVPLGFDLIYPVLFILKAQYEVLLALVFWGMANDLYNTRQSKRLFPLITAGGVLGGIIGSFATPVIARVIALDNMMLAYLGTTVLGAVVVVRMAGLYPTLLVSEKKEKKGKSRSSIIGEFKKVLPLMKESTLAKILVLLTLMPNVVIPIMNYQFNFAIDQAFESETRMITFFGYFRGVLNAISFVILLFVGRLYGRWGLPVALMFHPFNYLIAFFAFLFRFDIFSAMYARISTVVLRTTINNPARAILMGLFPVAYRGIIRPFLRGTIVRIGILIGSGLIMVSEGWLHPRYLSLGAAVFVLIWFLSTIWLKRAYSGILLDLISGNMLDLKSMEEEDISQIFQDKKIQSQLVESFLSSKGSTCVWYAELIKSQGIANLDAHILSVIREQDDETKIGLLELMSAEAGKGAVQVFDELVDPEKPALNKAVMKAASRISPEFSSGFLKDAFDTYESPEIRAYALIGLHRIDKSACTPQIKSWLSSPDLQERGAGIIAAGGSKRKSYIDPLKEMLEQEKDEGLVISLLNALYQLEAKEINDLVLPYLRHLSQPIRRAALDALDVSGDDAMRVVIPLLGDESDGIQKQAATKLQNASHENGALLIESLVIPNRTVREGIFSLLESLQIKDVDVLRFARSQVERAYINLAESESLKVMEDGQDINLLIEHLSQKKQQRLENILRVLATQDRSGQMRIIWRGIFSPDSRQKSNAIEALEDSLGHALSKNLVPLIEDQPPSQALSVGKKAFQLPEFDSDPQAIYSHLLAKHDWVTNVLTLNLISKVGSDGLDRKTIEPLLNSDNPNVRQMALQVAKTEMLEVKTKETEMEKSISIPDKILHLRGIQIFEGLSVSELAAIASVTEEVVFPQGEEVIVEGEPGETMYLITDGEVSVLKDQKGGARIELDRMQGGNYFGEMALFEDQVRSATIRTEKETMLLVLHKREFTEIVREYPQIALHICKAFSERLRGLHERIQNIEKA